MTNHVDGYIRMDKETMWTPWQVLQQISHYRVHISVTYSSVHVTVLHLSVLDITVLSMSVLYVTVLHIVVLDVTVIMVQYSLARRNMVSLKSLLFEG